MRAFIKGALAGGVGAAALIATTAAIAGSGVGAVFNLGQTNHVNETTELTGAKAGGAQLQVTNTSSTGSATGLSVTTAAGKPPLTVSNKVLIPKLNAQYLNGRAVDSFGRIAMASNEDFSGGFPFSSQVTVSITAPAKGFISLEGNLGVFDGSASSFCGDCEVGVRIRDVASGVTSPMSLLVTGSSTRSSYEQIPTEWVFPVTPGAHDYSLDAGQVSFSGGPLAFHNPVLIAQYVPYGATGSATSLSRQSHRAARLERLPTRP